MKRHILTSLFLMTLLSGCGTTLLVAGAASGTTLLYDQRSTHTMIDDLKLAPYAKKILSQDPDLHGQSDLQFHSYNHTLLITGQVSSEALQERLTQLAYGLSGVKLVSNQTRVTQHHEPHNAMRDT